MVWYLQDTLVCIIQSKVSNMFELGSQVRASHFSRKFLEIHDIDRRIYAAQAFSCSHTFFMITIKGLP